MRKRRLRPPRSVTDKGMHMSGNRTALEIAQEAVQYRERAWELYGQILDRLLTREQAMSASSEDLDELLLRISRYDLPHAGMIYEVLADRRASGYEPDRPQPFSMDIETVLEIGALNQERITAERTFDSYCGDILNAVGSEGIEAGEQVLEVLPASAVRAEVRRLIDRLMAMQAPTP
jgi:hypothetical protein